MSKITKAVITAAGQGTRFLPATKNVSKELIPIINKPIIQYKVEACIEAGITDIIIVTRPDNHLVEDFFNPSPKLEGFLKEKGKLKEAEMIEKIYSSAHFTFINQDPSLPYGQASPLFSARSLLNNEPFFYGYGDDFFLTKDNYIKEMIDFYNKNSVEIILSTFEVDKSDVSKWGIITLEKDGSNLITGFVEKPKVGEVDSNLSSGGSYILPPDVFEHLDPKILYRGEFIFQQCFDYYLPRKTMYAYNVDGKFLTNGDPMNFLISNVEVALSREDLKDEFRNYLEKRIKE